MWRHPKIKNNPPGRGTAKGFSGGGFVFMVGSIKYTKDEFFQSDLHFVNCCLKTIRTKFGNDSIEKPLIRFLYLAYKEGTEKQSLYTAKKWYLPHLYLNAGIFQTNNFKELDTLIKEVDQSIKNVTETKRGFSCLRYSHLELEDSSTHVEFNIEYFQRKGFYLPDNIENKIYGKPGIYRFYNDKKELIYIGRSVDLFSRVFSSAKERNPKYVDFIICKTQADAYIIEPYLISLFKPLLNSEFKSDSLPTLKIDFPKPTQMFKFKRYE